VSKYSRMEIRMKASGCETKLMVRANSGTPTATTTKASGSMTRHTVKVSTSQRAAPATWANGRMTCSTAMEKRPGTISRHSKGST